MAPQLEHIIVLMLENSSFDRMLGALFAPRGEAGADGGGVKGLAGNFSNIDPTSNSKYSMRVTTAREMQNDPGHDYENVVRQLAGSNSGFVADFSQTYPDSTSALRQEIMSYYEDWTLPVLHALAHNFTVCDRWFSSLPGPTWPNRLFLYSGTSLGHMDMKLVHYWDQPTLFDVLTTFGISYRLYYGDISNTYILVNKPDVAFTYPYRYFHTDVKDHAQFPQFSLIEPSYFWSPNDQHPPHDVFRGEALIAEVYNALRSNDDLWQRSLLVVCYDEHGGFYDHVSPPATTAPDAWTDGTKFDFRRLGARVPAIAVSPWFDNGVVEDTFDHTSLTKFVLQHFGLPCDRLGARVASDETSTLKKHLRQSPRDTKSVLPFIPIPAFLPAQTQVALTEHQKALVDLSHGLAKDVADESARIALMRPAAITTPQGEAHRTVERFEAFLLDNAKHQNAPQLVT